MLELAALLIVVTYLAWDRHHTARILAAASPDLAELIALTDRLAQRVQAPTLATLEHDEAITNTYPAPIAVPMDDDDAHWESKEQLAQRLAALEQLEHEKQVARAG
jgi:hypothetical protein